MSTEETVLRVILEETGNMADSETPMEDLGLESLDFLELMLRIEEAIGVPLSSETVQGIETVGHIFAAIEAARALNVSN